MTLFVSLFPSGGTCEHNSMFFLLFSSSFFSDHHTADTIGPYPNALSLLPPLPPPNDNIATWASSIEKKKIAQEHRPGWSAWSLHSRCLNESLFWHLRKALVYSPGKWQRPLTPLWKCSLFWLSLTPPHQPPSCGSSSSSNSSSSGSSSSSSKVELFDRQSWHFLLLLLLSAIDKQPRR